MAQWILIDRKANISNSIYVAIANCLGVYYSKNDTCNNNVISYYGKTFTIL